jgi:hypothetical protein
MLPIVYLLPLHSDRRFTPYGRLGISSRSFTLTRTRLEFNYGTNTSEGRNDRLL